MEKDVGLLQLSYHLLGIGHEIWADIAPVELHALDDVELGFEALCLLDGDHPLVADLLHRIGNHLADLTVIVG